MNQIRSTRDMLNRAQLEGYAVPAFNIHNMESLQTVAKTAAELGSPVIIAGTPSTIDRYAGGDFIQAMAAVCAGRWEIPLAIHLDHFEDVAAIAHNIDLGFRSCMIDASMLPFEENIKQVRQVVAYAHERDTVVEAELGRLGGREDDLTVAAGETALTDPQAAAEFVARTGIDSLAVAIGTAHGLYKGEPHLDFERLSEIREQVFIPLVLHGASDVPDELVQEAIRRGICKVNVATDLKIPFAQAVKAFFQSNPDASDPRYYMAPGKAAMAEVVAHKISVCGSEGRYLAK
ncbi:MAG: tagatose-bisphosphate aldolase subunit GatY [Eubacterium sp.]